MRRLAFVLLLLLAPAGAAAQAVTVQSGEHEGFSRLVLNIGTAAAWEFGRTEDGYALQLGGPARPFDLSRVFDLIPKDRVVAIWADPENGSLNLRVACACHAMPFEFQPGVLVIDVRDGPAPAGSSFELSADGSPPHALAEAPVSRPRMRPDRQAAAGGPAAAQAYDWQTYALDPAPAADGAFALPDLTAGAGQDVPALRDSLLRGLGAGAAQGVVTLELPGSAEPGPSAAPGAAPQVRIGQDLGIVVLPGGKEGARGSLAADGSACIDNARLDIAAWGSDEAPVTALARMREGLVGEFDDPDPQALDRAVRYLLNLGFGAEARQLLNAFDTSVPDRDVLSALALIVDGAGDPQAVFAPMSGCATAAALWAALAADDLSALPGRLDTGAVLRAFAALPPHLRRTLGPGLADRFISAGDAETARAVTDAVLRAGDAPDAAARLAEAKVGLALGDTAAAASGLEAVASENTVVTPDALIALVAVRAREGGAMTPGQIGALTALVQEYRGTPLAADLQRALAVAHATAGDFDAAFRTAGASAPDVPELWQLLADHGTDAAVLTQAVLPPGMDPPDVGAEVRRTLARRLAGLGLPDPSLRWLPAEGAGAADERLAAAAAQKSRHDGLSVLASLNALPGEDAARLRAEAHLMLGQPDQAALQYAAIGDTEGAKLAARRAGDWADVAAEGATAWADAARLVTGSDPQVLPDTTAPPEGTESPGPLARGQALLDDSAAARSAIVRLLEEVPLPSAGAADRTDPTSQQP